MGLLAKELEKTSELAANFLEHFPVAACYGIAGARKRCGRIDRAEHRLARHFSVQLRPDTLEGTSNAPESS